MGRFAAALDRFTGRIGGLVSWLALVMVLVGAYNAVVRYLGRFMGWSLASNVYIELQWYLFSLLFLLAAPWALAQDAHVRVDVVLARFGARSRALVDLLGGVLFLLPFCAAILWVSWPSVWASWRVREGSPDPGGLPRYPLKAVILLAFVLLALQGVSEVIKAVQRLRVGEGAERPPARPVEVKGHL